MQLPGDLRAALETELSSTASREMAAASQALSQRYRDRARVPGATLLQSSLDARSYAAYRMPATFAASAAALIELQARLPDLSPRSLLDVGGGPGTASWAALDIWPEIETVTVIERDPEMIQIGKALARHASSGAIRDAPWHQADLTGEWGPPKADLVVAGYVLGELAAEAQSNLVERLWAKSIGACVLVEPGTPRGSTIIREATEVVDKLGAHIVAPFPAGWSCLEHHNDWCHFAERVARTRLHRTAKGAELSYEDEKFSYVGASRMPGTPITARVIRQPQVRSGHVRLVLCTADGVRHVVVTRSQKEAYRRARDLKWGSAIEVGEAPVFGLDAGISDTRM